LVAADICSNDVGREFSVEVGGGGWSVIWHSLSASTKYHAGQNRDDDLGSP
jgi:hypothetical protein